MKLRNKKTGEIFDWREDLMPFGLGLPHPKSLAELNEEWEDYKPAEPLIKDEKIRKLVRAWAEVNGVEQVIVEKDFSSYTFFPTDTSKVGMSVWTDPSLSNLSKDNTYTITELCGEEKK